MLLEESKMYDSRVKAWWPPDIHALYVVHAISFVHCASSPRHVRF